MEKLIFMDTFTLEIVGKVAGIGGLSLGVLLIIYRNILAKNIFPMITKQHAARIILVIIILTFVIALTGIASWVYLRTQENKLNYKQKPYNYDNVKILKKVFEKRPTNHIDEDIYLSIKIEYPEIVGLKTSTLEQKINEKIKTISQLYDAKNEEDLELKVSFEIKYRWKNYLAIFFDYSSYTRGSVHPISYQKSLVLNLDNGEKYELKDLFRIGYEKKLTKLILNYLQKINYEDHNFGSESYDQIKGNETYSYNGKYLFIYFSQGGIAPPTMGPVTVKIEIEKLKNYVTTNGPISFLL